MNDGIQQTELDVVGFPMLTPDRLPPAYLTQMLATDPQRQGSCWSAKLRGES
jgi:hypothetical protein